MTPRTLSLALMVVGVGLWRRYETYQNIRN